MLAYLDMVFDWLTARAPLLTGAAAVTGAIVAVLGYRKWHVESIGKRKVELAEEVLAAFYEARDAIAWARHPGGFSSEGRSRPGRENENEEGQSERDAIYRVFERLNDSRDLFARIQSKKYLAMAYFGPAGEQPFQELKSILAEVNAAASTAIRVSLAGREIDPDMEAKYCFLGKPADDPVAQRMNAVIKTIEDAYSSWLRTPR